MIETLTALFAGYAAKSILAIWTEDKSILSAGENAVKKFINKNFSDYLIRRKSERFLDEIEDEIFFDLSNLISTEFSSHKTGDVRISCEYCFNYTISESFYITCINNNLQFDAIFDEFKVANINTAKKLFVSDELFFGIGFFIIQKFVLIVDTFPKFTRDSLKQILSDTAEILDRVANIESHFDRFNKILAPDLSINDQIYRQIMTKKLGRLNIFGVDTVDIPKRYDLTMAYVNLSLSRAHADNQENAILALSTVEKHNSQLRILSGDPGSGKTTIFSWIAISILQRKLPEQIKKFYDYFPIFIKLRDYSDKKFPTGNDLIIGQIELVSSQIDPSWITHVMQTRQILFLIDGYDELTEKRRKNAREWIDELLSSFNSSKAYLSTRPYASTELNNLVKEYGSDEVIINIEPMDNNQVLSLINKWHDAFTEQQYNNNKSDKDENNVLKNRLIKQIFTNTMLRNIVRTPLICSLICLVNSDRKGKIPKSKGELYRIATDALIRRDSERDIEADLPVFLDEKIIRKILCYISEYFYTRKSIQLPAIDISDSLKEYLPSLDINSNHANHIIKFLTERSHLLRSPSINDVDFSHKTFMEYFYSIRISERRNVEFVIRKFLDPDSLIINGFVLSIAPPDFSNKCISDILSEIDNLDSENRRRCIIQLQMFIPEISELDRNLRDRINSYITEILPPKNFSEADDLGSVGDIIIDPLMRFTAKKYRKHWEYCVSALISTSENEAMYALQKFAQIGNPKIDSILKDGENLFVSTDYKKIVLSHCKTLKTFNIESDADLDIAISLNSLEKITFWKTESDINGKIKKQLVNLKSLSIRSDTSLSSLNFLKFFPNISNIFLRGLKNIDDFSPIQECKNLESILIDSNQLRQIDFTEKLPRLRKVDFSECYNLESVQALRARHDLKIAKLPYSWMHDELELEDIDDIQAAEANYARIIEESEEWDADENDIQFMFRYFIKDDGTLEIDKLE
ncbi:NACHT domain-containing protein [Nisaea denitrificans]|uniref:NACHT domain-containing protein n=1 Tax=Nisaea denitrificans TaxID=390877 RepID=UPI0004063BCA|nr:NACHT domain-containing protein [Nisaea denitrificans]